MVKSRVLAAQTVKHLPTTRETQVRSLGWEHPPGEGNGNPLQYSCLENPMDWRSLVGYSSWGCKELDTTEWLNFQLSTFLLGRKVMTNLDSIFKSRDITLPTKVCLVKAMVFPVVMYGCESWTIKKIECWRIDGLNSGVGEDSWESLGLQRDPTSLS